MLVPFERDHVRKPLDGRLADQRACCPRARPRRVGFWSVAVRRSSYQSAALRSSARASGCSSRRTALFEFLQDLGPRVFPADRLNVTFSDFSGTPLQRGRPCRGDFLVRLLQTGKQFLRDTSAVNASQAQSPGKQLVRRHDAILPFASENGFDPADCQSRVSFGSVERFGLVKACPSGPHAPQHVRGEQPSEATRELPGC